VYCTRPPLAYIGLQHCICTQVSHTPAGMYTSSGGPHHILHGRHSQDHHSPSSVADTRRQHHRHSYRSCNSQSEQPSPAEHKAMPRSHRSPRTEAARLLKTHASPPPTPAPPSSAQPATSVQLAAAGVPRPCTPALAKCTLQPQPCHPIHTQQPTGATCAPTGWAVWTLCMSTVPGPSRSQVTGQGPAAVAVRPAFSPPAAAKSDL